MKGVAENLDLFCSWFILFLVDKGFPVIVSRGSVGNNWVRSQEGEVEILLFALSLTLREEC